MFDGDFNTSARATTSAEPAAKYEGIAPVLIKQVLDGSDEFNLWGHHFGMVVCVAIIRSIDTSSTKITYVLEDSTGRIEAHSWLEEGKDVKSPDIMLNNYAKVFGSVRSNGGQKALMIFKMLPVTNANEICTHMLEVLHARYKFETLCSKEPPIDFGMPTQQNTNNLGLDSKQLAVFEAIKNSMSTMGISRKELIQKFAHMKESELNSTLEFMISEGHIYSSIDSDHFLSTE